MKNHYWIFGIAGIALFFAIIMSFKNTDSISEANTIILQKNGELKKSEVRKFGVYCTAGWYRTIDNFYLKSDGTASDGPFNYRWTLHEFNSEQDKFWFNKNCKDVK